MNDILKKVRNFGLCMHKNKLVKNVHNKLKLKRIVMRVWRKFSEFTKCKNHYNKKENILDEEDKK